VDDARRDIERAPVGDDSRRHLVGRKVRERKHALAQPRRERWRRGPACNRQHERDGLDEIAGFAVTGVEEPPWQSGRA